MGLIQFATHQQFGTAEKPGLQPFTLEVGPLLEGRTARHAERREKRPSVQRDGGQEVLRLQRREKVVAIDGDRTEQRQFLGPRQRVVAE